MQKHVVRLDPDFHLKIARGGGPPVKSGLALCRSRRIRCPSSMPAGMLTSKHLVAFHAPIGVGGQGHGFGKNSRRPLAVTGWAGLMVEKNPAYIRTRGRSRRQVPQVLRVAFRGQGGRYPERFAVVPRAGTGGCTLVEAAPTACPADHPC